MGNVLQFSLGLATGNFLSGLGAAGGALGEFIGKTAALVGLAGPIAGVWNEINKGAEYFDLAMRTGEGVKNLVMLESGLKEAGVAASSVAPILNAMQRALGGFNEMGEPTKDIFKGLGLSVEELKGMEPARQFELIGKALATLNQSEAATAAGKIFGRGMGADALQAARQMSSVMAGMAGSKDYAETMERMAAAADQFDDTLRHIREKGRSFFAGIAEGALPGLQAIADKLNGIDLTGLGARIGQFLAAFGQSIKEGRFGEMLSLSLQVGMEQAINFFARGMQAAIAALPALKQGVGSMWEANFANFMGTHLGSLTGDDWAMEQALQWFQKRNELRRAGTEAYGKAFRDLMQSSTHDVITGGASEQLNKLMAGLVSRLPFVPMPALGGEEGLSGAGAARRKEKGDKIDVNELEKIGLLFFSGPSGVDYQRQTATNTKAQLSLMSKVNATLERMERKDGGNFNNIA